MIAIVVLMLLFDVFESVSVGKGLCLRARAGRLMFVVERWRGGDRFRRRASRQQTGFVQVGPWQKLNTYESGIHHFSMRSKHAVLLSSGMSLLGVRRPTSDMRQDGERAFHRSEVKLRK